MTHVFPVDRHALGIAAAAAAEKAVRAIPPLWPLATSVAVNPFLGQATDDLALTATRLQRVAGVAVTMPRTWFQEKFAAGEIGDDDLAAALAASPSPLRPASLAALKAALAASAPLPKALPTIADLAADATGIDWPGLVAERIGAFAGGHFDEGQALWAAPRGPGAYAAWRAFASRDLTPEIAGLSGFTSEVAALPETAGAALDACVEMLGISADALETYLHQLLMTLGGWSQLARQRLWQAELAGKADATATDLLTIRLVFEQSLLRRHRERIGAAWAAVVAAHGVPIAPTPSSVVDAILQEALERAGQRRLAGVLTGPAATGRDIRPALQMAFCIDVRSEVYRRALEAQHPGIVTLGFAGFFGLATAHRRFASDMRELRLPVLLNPAVFSCAGTEADAPADHAARIVARAKRAFGRFKLAAVSSFAFVEATGPLQAGKLLRDALGLGGSAGAEEPAPRLDPPLEPSRAVDAAETVLKAMSLTSGFARLVVIAGHGATVTNNPHASALQCGACGGHAGDVNARLLASLLNDPAVRAGLAGRGIAIPPDTLVLAALHDTTTDDVTLFAADHPATAHEADIARTRHWLALAGDAARCERALRLPRAGGASGIARRSRDWSELRPEWALAGCNAFIAAPRARTRGRDLAGRAFLHDYEADQDTDFRVLELIMTAPVIVASWISLQYYGSVVAPAAFGGGNKLLHNITGGIGVVEGNGGVLRAGLPWQSVHDGDRLMHEPLRLSVYIAAPPAAMTAILERHATLRALVDNRWLHLFALGPHGGPHWRYAGDLRWTEAGAAPSLHEAEHDLAAMRPVAMFEEVDALPAPEHHPA